MRTGSASRNSPPLGFLKTSPKNGSSYKPSRILSSLGILDKDTITGKNRRKSRKGGGGLSPKMTDSVYKKRGVDFTDFAYREAVNRLKYLLAESYTPTKMPQYHHRVGNDSADDTDYQSSTERPVLSEISKYFPQSSALTHFNTKRMMNEYPQGGTTKENFPLGLKPAYSTSSLQQSEIAQFTDVTNPPPPQELMNFIERQESYIEQLEKESQFCREELANLLSKVKNVITENETLTDQAKVGLTRTFFSNLDSSESDGEHGEGGKGLQMKYRQPKNLSFGPNIVFESRISELEAQLAQSAIDFKRLTEENESNKRKIALGVADTGSADIYRKQIDDLQKDKAMQEETIRKLQMHINEMKEADSFSKGQRARDFTEQVAFERAQAEIEIRRLKDELERQHERVREIQNEMARRISDERTNAERRYNYQVDQLGGDLTSQWETASKLQLELERQKRMETDCKRDLMQKNVQIDELKAEIKNKTAAWLSDVAQMNAEKQSLEQEITSLRMQLERAERQGKVETSRLNAEVNSLRQRLDRSDGDLLHARRENLRLSDQISALEKEIALGEIAREPRPKEMSKIITDMEAKHANTVSELEGMIHDQRQLMEKLTSECKTLTQKLEDTSLKHKNDTQILRQTNRELMERLRQIWTSYKDINPLYRNGKGLNKSSSSDSETHNHTDKKHMCKMEVTSMGEEEVDLNTRQERNPHQTSLSPQPPTTMHPQNEATPNNKNTPESAVVVNQSAEEWSTTPHRHVEISTSTAVSGWKWKSHEQMSENSIQISHVPEVDRVYWRSEEEVNSGVHPMAGSTAVYPVREVDREEMMRQRLKEEMKRELQEWSCSRNTMEQVNWDNLAERRQQWSTPVGEIIRQLEGKSQEILSSLSTMQQPMGNRVAMGSSNKHSMSSTIVSSMGSKETMGMGISSTSRNMIPISMSNTAEKVTTNNSPLLLMPNHPLPMALPIPYHQQQHQQVSPGSPPRKLSNDQLPVRQEQEKYSKSMQNRLRALQMWGTQIPENNQQANYCQNSLPRQLPPLLQQQEPPGVMVQNSQSDSLSNYQHNIPDDGFRISISSPSLFECSTSSSSPTHSPIPTVQERL
ncbi:uncharacterized protein LOC129795435 isoform X2 [Lutzomyia longipalpis]|uniref:uncharacterized protein LOC129795435 isoform X2 n=1 Tax=Lutzomyia longipalpis TaxID=7200 RepID=UPI002483E5CE|nr:uncharacterized protein LOC129795435 isoform X2 [Lutzomyia longipalpis]